MNEYVTSLMAEVKAKNPAEPEFHQAVQEVAESLALVLDRHPEYRHAKILERIIEPERVILFRVPWVDDQGEVQVNRGFRIEMNSAIGPYKGGLRFHPSVNLGILKFLAFEQVFKNSLTTLPMGGGKGGSDFDPKGKSDNEVMRFCQAFMTELFRHIGPDTDVPAGDIGVGGREIGYLFGHVQEAAQRVHRRPHRQGPQLGRLAHPARGHRLRLRVLRAGDARRRARRRSQGKTCLVSGSGNVSQYTVEKILDLGGKVRHALRLERVRLRRGGDRPREAEVRHGPEERPPRPHQGVRRQVQDRGLHPDRPQARLQPALEPQGPLRVPERDPERDQRQGRREPAEERRLRGRRGRQHADARSTRVKRFLDAKILYGPGKAANAGGVATSGLEMSQNSMRLSWSREEVDQRLHGIMKSIHKACWETAERFGTPGNYVNGANIAGFLKVANAMMDQGVV